MDDVDLALRQMLSKFIGTENVGPGTELYQQLGLAGDDAAEFMDEVHKRFGVSFAGFQFDDFFLDETQALGAHLGRLLGLRSRKKPLTFGHLTRVVERGRWFEP